MSKIVQDSTTLTLKQRNRNLMKWASYFRENPQVFARSYLNIHLKDFQKVLLYQMEHNDHYTYIASRGIGKSWLTALYITIRCILYPGTKVVIAAGVRKQGRDIIQKISKDFCLLHSWGSDNLNREIKFLKDSTNELAVVFNNGSTIDVVTANDNARGSRAHLLVVDEFRMVKLEVIDTVLKKFRSDPRHPGYLDSPKYAHLAERNKDIYCSSAWFQSHWSYTHFRTYMANMFDDTKNYYVTSIPYQMAIRSNLLLKEQVQDEMSEATFNPITWSFEMESLFYGASEGAFFDFEVLNNRRTIKTPFYPTEVYQRRNEKPPKRIPGERRILSVDVALMASTKHRNDASSFMINSALPETDLDYISHFVYLRNYEGLTTDELGLTIMKTFYDYDCTDLVLDSNGVGLGVFDFIVKDQYDPDTGITYKAFQCVNDKAMADRCHVRNANKCLWSIKASSQFNTTIATLLRSELMNGKIQLLCNEIDGEDYIKEKTKGWNKLSPQEQSHLIVPYIMTSMLINELINLEHTYNDGKVKISEKSGMRKDMYSSMAYNVWVVSEIQRKRRPVSDTNWIDKLVNVTKKQTLDIGF